MTTTSVSVAHGMAVIHDDHRSVEVDYTSRAREAAWERHGAAKADRDSWARLIAIAAVRSELPPTPPSGDALIVARAAAFEAGADWNEALDRNQAARDAR